MQEQIITTENVTEYENVANTSLTPVTNTSLVGGFDLPDPELVAKRAEQTKKTLAAACSVLSYSDITIQGGKPYIDHYGCKKIANMFGLIVRQNEVNGHIDYQKQVIDEASNHYIITITGKVWHVSNPQNYEIYEGSADSFDDFFRAYQITRQETTTNDKGEEKTKTIVVSAQTLPINKVQEKATANLLQRAIKKKLGLQFTKEELEECGFDMSKVKGFNFNGGSGADSAELIAKRQEVWNKIMEICGGDSDLAKKTLKKHTAFKDFAGHTDINKVKETQLNILAKTVDSAYKDFQKQIGATE